MGRPPRGKGGRGRGRGRQGRHRPRRSGLDAERVLAALSREPLPATRLLRRLDGDRSALRGLRRLLSRLEEEGRAERVSGGWRRARGDGLVEAELVEVRERGGGRAVDGAGREWRLPDVETSKPGDRILIAPGERGRAVWVGELGGERDHWVGILRRHGKLLGISPYRDEGDWFVRVARSDVNGAEEGEVVEAVPAEAPRRREAWAVVRRRLGRPGDPDADFAAVVWRHRLPDAFPADVLEEAAALREPGARELRGRADLRELPFVTIDPATARDHDDAVYVERRGSGFRLHVAIADVSHFVAAGSALDREARRRGNSVYFPDRAIPMLPERLSSQLCSLRPDVDRLVLCVELDFDARGRPGPRRFRPAVLRSRARLAYEEAAEWMESGVGHPEAPMLKDLWQLAEVLWQRRVAAGSLDFALPRPVYQLDAEGRPVDARPEPRSIAHRAIEEAMLAANTGRGRPAGRGRRGGRPPHPRAAGAGGGGAALQRAGSRGPVSGRRARDPELPGAGLGARAGLRQSGRALAPSAGPAQLSRARYSAVSQVHYALSFEHYLHFTSPIRRFADLEVHRALKAFLAGEEPALSRARAEQSALRASHRERVAVAAEREMDQLKACVLLREHLRERQAGSVTGLAPHGLYVTLDAWWVEGLVHVSRLPGYFELEEGGRALVGPGRRYALGDRVEVEIAAADPVSARIDFELLEPGGSPEPGARGRAGRRRPERPRRAGRKRTRRRR